MSSWVTRINPFGKKAGITREDGEQISSPSAYSKQPAAPVTFDTAMQQSAFWACVRLISETVAAMPLQCFKLNGESKTISYDYKLWRVLNYQPNRYQTRIEFFESMVLNLATTGNAYAKIQRDDAGNVVSLIPIMTAQTTKFLFEDGSIGYKYETENGHTQILAEDSVWHIFLFGNGLIGLSPLSYARQSIGIATAIDNRVSTLASNGGKTTGILTIDKALTDVQRKEVKAKFAGLEAGGNDGLFVLEAGFEYHQTALSPADQQMLENRRFQVEDIARFMMVPSVLINDTSGTTAWGSGIEQIMDGFYKLNLRPYLERIEASIKRYLMPMGDWDDTEIEFNFDSLLRASQETRFKTLKEGVNSGIMTPNEARKSEGLPSKPGGDDIYLNGTMQVAGTAKAETVPREATSGN